MTYISELVEDLASAGVCYLTADHIQRHNTMSMGLTGIACGLGHEAESGQSPARVLTAMQFDGQIVVITGASRGIGRALAIAFSNRGALVACVSTTAEGATAVADEVGGLAFKCDVSDRSQVAATFNEIERLLGPPSVLVNNAGISRDSILLRMTENDWDRVMDVNLTGVFHCSREVAKAMTVRSYGRIVNISSAIALCGVAGGANYAASKAALLGFTRSMAKEFGSSGITCNLVAPGMFDTDMSRALPESYRKEIVGRALLGRLGYLDELSHAVMFLASQESSYITGQILVVDGGQFSFGQFDFLREENSCHGSTKI